MRIITTSPKAPEQKNQSRPKRWLFLIALVIFTCISLAFYFSDSSRQAPDKNMVQNVEIPADQQTAVKVPREFTPTEFKLLYSSFAYPFTVQIEAPPPITASPVADKRIQDLAGARGYELRSVPIANQLVEVSPGFFAQKLTAESFQKLFDVMNSNNLPLKVTSVYRSIDDQLALFTERLIENGVDINDTESIALGEYDVAISKLLETAAPPGYSRHHTGYTVDFQCGWAGLKDFESSPCYSFMSANNYKVMKDLGFIPSYPKGAELQGPEPESWEYIWVGMDALY
jgi:LAS superfamily LD-carboxypeptidase LdcB